MPEADNEKKIEPSTSSVFMVVRLLCEALIDLVLLPFRLAGFMFTRKKTVSHIEKLLQDQNPSCDD